MNEADRILLTDLKDDIKEIRNCLLGDKYRSAGLVGIVERNTEDIGELKTKQAKVMSFWGGITMFLTIAVTSIVNFFIFRK